VFTFITLKHVYPARFRKYLRQTAKTVANMLPLPHRETGGKIPATMETQAFTMAYETNFDLFHGRSEQDGLRTPLERKKR
jgi:hypothetical protein